jgi:hypothetical protein
MQLKATLRRLVNSLSSSAGRIFATRLRNDAPPPINLKDRDPDYYSVQLVILVSLVVIFRDILV